MKKKSLEDALYDLNDAVQALIEDYRTEFLGDQFEDDLLKVDGLVTEMCIIHDAATLFVER